MRRPFKARSSMWVCIPASWKGFGITYFIAKQTNDKGISLLHYTYVYKSEDAFWLVQFAVREGQAASQLENISKWAHSVKFN